jgi:hypothetical protein
MKGVSSMDAVDKKLSASPAMQAARLLRRRLPQSLYVAMRAAFQRARRISSPPGSLCGLEPRSRVFGMDRGTPIDRHYIESFLGGSAADIRGRVLEIGDPRYTRRFGGANVTHSDVLHAVEGNPQATLVGDLAAGESIPADAFDCVILTQTLQFIYDARAAVATVHRSLAAGGVVLATLPGIAAASRYDRDRWGEFWRFTHASALRMFEESFGRGHVQVRSYGNVRSATAFLHGLACEELAPTELNALDEDYEVILAVRAKKAPKP